MPSAPVLTSISLSPRWRAVPAFWRQITQPANMGGDGRYPPHRFRCPLIRPALSATEAQFLVKASLSAGSGKAIRRWGAAPSMR